MVISLKALFLYSLTLTFREAHVNHICFIVEMVRSEWDMQEQQLSRVFSRVHATLQPALSVRLSAGRLVGGSVIFYFFL